MEIGVRSTPVARLETEALVLPVFEKEDATRAVAAAGRALAASAGALVATEAFTGAADEVRVLHAGGTDRIRMLALVGAGSAKAADPDALRRAVAAGCRAVRDARARSVAVVVPAGAGARRAAGPTAEVAAEGALLGLYRFEAYKSKPARTGVERLTFVAPRGETRRVERSVARGRIVADAVCLARDLGNHPGNVATPTWLAGTAQRIAEREGLALEVLEEEDMRRLGMGALLGVSQGSREPAKLIVLTYAPRRAGRVETVALVGKGLTFDAGGISIKPAAKMEDMKFDMCGGAAVLAALQAVAQLRLPLRVVGLVPSSENLPDGASYKPGDILKAMNGVTIEVRNTDAEGRLILADALAYATTRLRPRPKAVIDLATLTGACVVALGDQFAGLVSNDDRLAERVVAAGRAAGDPAWHLPLVEGYRKQLASPYADTSNLGATPGAGALTAAAFLEKFVGSVPWAHLDIAGVAWTDRKDGYLSKGGTGAGVRLLCRLLSDWRKGR